MKRVLSLLTLGSLTLSLPAQQAPAPAAPTPKAALTPDQASNVLKQLADLERTILQQRGTNLGGIIQKLRTAASSDAAAVSFIEDCDKLVNVERKDADAEVARKIEEKAQETKRPGTGKEEEREGEWTTSLRICLEFLALSLEASTSADLSLMVPKVQSFHQSLISQGKKLRGRSGDVLYRPLTAGGAPRRGNKDQLEFKVVIDAYQLDRHLHREGWPLEPANITRMYQQVILKPSLEKHKTDIASIWDTGIAAEVSFRKARLAEGEFVVWQQNEYPVLRWMRAEDLAKHGADPVSGMAEMLKVIKEYPAHPSSPEWVKQLREMVTPALPEAAAPVAP